MEAADRFTKEIPLQLVAAGVPPQLVQGLGSVPPDVATKLDITGTGDLGARLVAAFGPAIQPIVANIVNGIHAAFSIAIASTFWIGIVGAVVAAVLVVFLHEVPMRQTFEVTDYAPEPAPGAAPG